MTPDEIKAALKEKGVTQTELKRRTGFGLTYVHEVIHGTRANREIQRAVARAIAQPVDAVFPVPTVERRTPQVRATPRAA